MISTQEKEIIEKLKKVISYDAPQITQNQFNNMIDYIINEIAENPKEIMWRLCGCYEKLNFNKVIDFFIESKDAYYVSELVSYVSDNLDQEYLTKKLLETNDLEFISNAMSNCGNAMSYALEQKYVDKIRDFIKKIQK